MARGWRSSLPMALLVALLPTACRQQEAKESAKGGGAATLWPLPDIPLLTFTDGSPSQTDLGSNYGILLGPEDKMPKAEKSRPAVHPSLKLESGNPYVSLRYERLARPNFFTGVWLSVFGHTDDPQAVLRKIGRAGHSALEVHSNGPNDKLGADRWAPGAVCRWRNISIKKL